MKLADLSRLELKDLQKIDVKYITETIQKRNDILLSVLAVGITLIVLINKFNQSSLQVKKLQAEITAVEQKISAIKNHDKTKDDLDDFLSQVPEGMSGDEMVNLLTDLAARRNIQILSVSPAQTTTKDLYDATNTSLLISASSYEDLWLFIHDIEDTDRSLRINRIDASMEKTTLPVFHRDVGRRQPQGYKFNVHLDITSVHIKTGDEKTT